METYVNHLYVAGRRESAHSGARLGITNPATEEEFGSIADADDTDVDVAVRAAHTALTADAWRSLTPANRADLLDNLATVLDRRADEFVEVLLPQNGFPVAMQRLHVMGAANLYRYYAGVVRTYEFEELRTYRGSNTLVRKEPVGVAGLIAPWNGPQPLAAFKIAPALAAGCTVVLKPAPQTSLDAFLLADAVAEAGFPPGVFNVITGGAATGAALVAHPGVRKVAFTGSTAAGRAIAQACAADFKPVTLELGGKSAAILLEDADMELFAAKAARLCAPETGQVCFSHTRVLAPRARYDETVQAVTAALAATVTGDPRKEDTTMGPLISQAQRERVEQYIALGREQGGRVVLGGGRPTGLDRGYYLEPTVFDQVDNSMRIARDEIFGPVVAVIPYSSEAEAIAIANDSDYGLAGCVFSQDVEHALQVARQIETGSIGVNMYGTSHAAPFGGVKASGMGRELGPEGLTSYLAYKAIYGAPDDAVLAPAG
ncbi:aldehyde dehydrogenase family protein [Dactylosporangium sp. NPDC006015]|uniref:aldehyde dehydrogenase family protein n=1 Tax=Dactylosporangium sp. NPDC006015 TaxID=3154576 RepID=UPI00339E4BDA